MHNQTGSGPPPPRRSSSRRNRSSIQAHGDPDPSHSGSSDSGSQALTIYGLKHGETHQPRLEEDHRRALDDIGDGWRLIQQFKKWPHALSWFNMEMEQYRLRAEIPSTRSTATRAGSPDVQHLPVSDGVSALRSAPRDHDLPSPTLIIQSEETPVSNLPTNPGYVGLEKAVPFKRVCIQESLACHEEIQKRINDGFQWSLRLSDAAAATSWVQGRPGTTDRSDLPVDARVPSPYELGGDQVTNQAAPSMFMVSSDPSAGDDNKIYGIDIIDQDQLNRALAPNNLPQGKDMLTLYEKFIDVAALPGMSVNTSEAHEREEQMQDVMEITAMAISQATSADKTGRAMMFKSRTNNALLYIKTESELVGLQDKIRRAVEDDLKSQAKQVRTFMHKRGYPPEYIAAYVDSGGLPRMIRKTVENYKSLVEHVIQALRSHSDGSLQDSYAQAMLKYWANKLANTRKRAVDYRDHVLEVYVVLRDAEKKRFQDELFHRVMWQRFEALEASMAGRVTPEKNPNPGTVRCNHCKHRLGHETPDCPLHSFKSAHATALLNGAVGKAKCAKLTHALKELVKPTNSDTEIVAGIEAARTDIGI